MPGRSETHIVAALQMSSQREVSENLEVATRLLKEARERGATVAGLPENFSYMGPERDKPALAEDLEGPTISRIREVARELGLAVVAGTFPERSDDPGRFHNTSVLVAPDGEIAAVYRKIHLFDVDLPGGESHRESAHIVPGREVVAARAAGLVHGLTVCYDLRFAELFRRLGEQGAELVWVPAAFTLHTGKDHWEVLLRARAIENGAYVVAPAQFGSHGPRRRTYGNALVADPWGKVLARAPDRAPAVALAEIDLAYREKVRTELPSWRHHVL